MSRENAIPAAIIAGIFACVVAVIGLGLPLANRLVDIYVPPVTPSPHSIAPTLTPTVTATATSGPSPTPALAQVRSADEMTMVYVPAGTFQMGSTASDSDASQNEFPQHSVTLDGFWIDRTEVTNEQYRQCVEAGVCQAPTVCDVGDPTYEDASKVDHPVICVNWYAAQMYCEWAGARLPTEAEWEYAARGPKGYIFPWGNTFEFARLNSCDINCPYDYRRGYDDKYGRTAPVQNFPDGVSWCGALNMGGNAWEWVNDWYDPGYYASSPSRNPTGPSSGEERGLRGGGWDNTQKDIRATLRHRGNPGGRHYSVGFRCVLPTIP